VDPTLIVAIYGAVTGTIGALAGGVSAVAAIRTGADARWGRRAKVAGELRPALTQLRDVIAEARMRPDRVRLRTPRTRTDLDLIQEITARAADRQLCRHLHEVHLRCSLVTAAEGPARYQQMQAMDAALGALNVALRRLDKIERRAPR
jgi:hypothetical protein